MVTTERVNLKKLIKIENTTRFTGTALDFAQRVSPELVANTQVVINEGEGVPDAYFSYLPDKDTLFTYHPLTGNLFVRMGGLDIANGFNIPDVTRWTSTPTTPKSGAAILAARILLSDMVALTELPVDITRPLSCLEHSRAYGYPKLEKLLKSIGIKGDSEKQEVPPLVDWDAKTKILAAGTNEGWALVTFHFGNRLSSIHVIDQSHFEVRRCDIGHRIVKLDDETHVTDIHLDGLTESREWGRWVFNRVWGLDANARRGTHYDVGLSGDEVMAIELPLETIHEIRKFEQPNFPWEFPELSYDRE